MLDVVEVWFRRVEFFVYNVCCIVIGEEIEKIDIVCLRFF